MFNLRRHQSRLVDLAEASLGDEISARGPDGVIRTFRLQFVGVVGDAAEWRFVETDPFGDLPVEVPVEAADGSVCVATVAPCLSVWAWPTPSGTARVDTRFELVAIDGVDPIGLADWMTKTCGLADWSEHLPHMSNIYAAAMPDELYYEHLRTALMSSLDVSGICNRARAVAMP